MDEPQCADLLDETIVDLQMDRGIDMTVGQLRKMIIWSMLGLSGATVLFFILAPVLGYPLESGQGWAIAQISVPVFAGYLGTATQFALAPESTQDSESNSMLGLIVIGSLTIYVIGTIAILFSFWLSNRNGAPIGTGISIEILSTVLTTLLGIVTITSNIAVAQMFKRPDARP